MSFTGKATYSAGAALPEIAEDVADLVSINAPHETPLLDAIGDPARVARSTVHEWIEDTLLPNTDTTTANAPGTSITVANAGRFRTGDLVRFTGQEEIVLVQEANTTTNVLTVIRGYGNTESSSITTGLQANIIGNAALEGADADDARFTTRTRVQNVTQIFSATVSVSGSELAANQIAVRDELAWQKNLRSRELLRDLENSVINGVSADVTPEGTTTVRRTMRGIVSYMQSNRFTVGTDGFPEETALTETQLNLALREIWKNSSGQVDLILVNGREKRSINQFITSSRRYYGTGEAYKDAVSVYESDFGVCRVVLSRYVPAGCVLLLDSSRLSVLPLAGRSFQYTPLARTGDAENGQLIGEYTLECRNESAHGIIRGFTA
ncbi:MAG: DUF5309 family protein [Tepidisphaeraceae bacterium]